VSGKKQRKPYIAITRYSGAKGEVVKRIVWKSSVGKSVLPKGFTLCGATPELAQSDTHIGSNSLFGPLVGIAPAKLVNAPREGGHPGQSIPLI
jgi:hypothetical protein